MKKGITINTGNIDRIFKSIYENARRSVDDIAQHVGTIIDFELYWMICPVGEIAAKKATKLNRRGKKILSIFDKRTLGGKFYQEEKLKERARFTSSS